MAKLVILALCLLSLWQLSVAQAPPQCSTLNVDNPLQSPGTGSNLGVCTTQSSQCCTQAYIDDVTQRAQEFLQNGLREELEQRIGSYNDIVQRVTGYFTSDFTDQFLENLRQPLSRFISSEELRMQLLSLIQGFENNIQIVRGGGSAFNVTGLVANITQRLETLAGRLLGGTNTTRQMCVINVIRQHVNLTAINQVARGLEQIRQGVSAAFRIYNFLQNYNQTVGNFRPLRQCWERLVQLSFCSRCTRNIPPLCSNTCGALVRACYSPFVAGLRGEFNNLWNVTRQVVRATNNTLVQLFNLERQVFQLNIGSLIGDLGRCGVSLSGLLGRRRRQSPLRLIPSVVMDRLNQLRGVFEFDEDGPEICEPASDRCNDDSQRCGSRTICTAACNCWDGTMNRTTDTPRFTDSSIEGQVNNPVIQLDQDMLVAQARSLGTPVNSFLTGNNFTEVSPDGVNTPPPEPYGGGAMSTVVSLTVMLLATVLSISL